MRVPTQRTFVSWHAADDLPDSDTTVLVHCPEAEDPVTLGYHDGEFWRDLEGLVRISRVTHWAHLPEPPGGEA